MLVSKQRSFRQGIQAIDVIFVDTSIDAIRDIYFCLISLFLNYCNTRTPLYISDNRCTLLIIKMPCAHSLHCRHLRCNIIKLPILNITWLSAHFLYATNLTFLIPLSMASYHRDTTLLVRVLHSRQINNLTLKDIALLQIISTIR